MIFKFSYDETILCYFHLFILRNHLPRFLILQVIIYRCLENGGFGLLQNYVDEDVRKTMPGACGC
jgi:hypothetical protein